MRGWRMRNGDGTAVENLDELEGAVGDVAAWVGDHPDEARRMPAALRDAVEAGGVPVPSPPRPRRT